MKSNPKATTFLLSEPFMPNGMYCPLACQWKAVYVLAMSKSFAIAKDDWQVVTIQTGPVKAVRAKEQLRRGRQFLVVSPGVVFHQEAGNMPVSSFCVSDAVGTHGPGVNHVFVLPGNTVHREITKKRKMSDASEPATYWEHFVNVASLVPIMTKDEAVKQQKDLNCGMGVAHFPIVLSGGSEATEYVAGIPYIEVWRDIAAGEELVCEAHSTIWHTPRTHQAPKRQTAAMLIEPAKKKAKLEKNDS